MRAALRTAVAIPLGLFTGMLVSGIVEQVSHRVWPVPAALDFGDRVAFQAHVDGLAPGPLVMGLAGWVAAVFAGYGAAALVARGHRRVLAWAMGGAVLAVALQTFALIAHPQWFVALSVAVLLATTACVVWLAGPAVDEAWDGDLP